MRAVVDTNILVSGLLHPASLPGAVLQAVERCGITPVVCDAIMAEYRDVLARPKLRLPVPDALRLMVALDRLAVWVEVPPYNGQPPLPDAADWPFIACALATGCPVITGYVRHFPLTLGLQVLTAREWADNAGPG